MWGVLNVRDNKCWVWVVLKPSSVEPGGQWPRGSSASSGPSPLNLSHSSAPKPTQDNSLVSNTPDPSPRQQPTYFCHNVRGEWHCSNGRTTRKQAVRQGEDTDACRQGAEAHIPPTSTGKPPHRECTPALLPWPPQDDVPPEDYGHQQPHGSPAGLWQGEQGGSGRATALQGPPIGFRSAATSLPTL